MSYVTLYFLDKEGKQAYIELPWQAGKRLKDYLRVPAVRSYGLLGKSLTARVVTGEGQKLKSNSVLRAGETVHIINVKGL